MEEGIRTIAISTGGGDAPGLNAVIRAATLAACKRGWRCFGIRDGYDGVLFPERYPNGGLIDLTVESVRGITHLGGTVLGTTNRGNPLFMKVQDAQGNWVTEDRSGHLIGCLKENGIDALITIGGDGSLTIGAALARKGFPVIGVPKTIDNDLNKTSVTFGFDSAVSFASECLDRLHTTAASHRWVLVVEVMGRYAGWIALHAGVAASADVILIPEIPFDIEVVADKIKEREARGRDFSIVLVAEGAKPIDGEVSVVGTVRGRGERLGGIAEKVAAQLEPLTKKEIRTAVLGHLLRGGTPTPFDRLLALRLGAAAVRGLAEGQKNVMVAVDGGIHYVPLDEATSHMKLVPVDSDIVATAKDLGISFGSRDL